VLLVRRPPSPTLPRITGGGGRRVGKVRRSYTGPKGVRLVPILEKSADFLVEIFQVGRKLKKLDGGIGAGTPRLRLGAGAWRVPRGLRR
jgi:hypothetical protein